MRMSNKKEIVNTNTNTTHGCINVQLLDWRVGGLYAPNTSPRLLVGTTRCGINNKGGSGFGPWRGGWGDLEDLREREYQYTP